MDIGAVLLSSPDSTTSEHQRTGGDASLGHQFILVSNLLLLLLLSTSISGDLPEVPGISQHRQDI